MHYTGSLRPVMRDAGLRPVEQLVGPLDVVVHTFGIVNYTALFLKDPTLACVAAKALTPLAAVELVAWASGPDTVEVASGDGRARVRWRSADEGRYYSYLDDGADVLHLARAAERLASERLLDADGYAHEDHWLGASAHGDYPDPLRRLALALTGDRVRSRATVLVSFGPGW